MVAADLGTAGSREITVRLGTENAFKTGIQVSLYFGVQYERGNRHVFFLLYMNIKVCIKQTTFSSMIIISQLPVIGNRKKKKSGASQEAPLKVIYFFAVKAAFLSASAHR
jgi:hypothetical protein